MTGTFIHHTLLVFLLYLVVAHGQFFPPPPTGQTVVRSQLRQGVTISYKETFICESTPGVRAWSGYVHLPPDDTRSYSINTFFWFFQARKNPINAPLAVWLNGGPGASSAASALFKTGPCTVLEDSNSTKLIPLSWTNEVNMLYIDQPVQVGFSYDSLVNGTFDLLSQIQTPQIIDFLLQPVPVQLQTQSVLVGTFPSYNVSRTAYSAGMAARDVWQFLQAWLPDFPEYNGNDKISIWGESYGGVWVSSLAGYIESQNDNIVAGTLKQAIFITLDTVGLVSGVVDLALMAASYPEMAYNNTYNHQFISEAEYISTKASVPECQQLIQQCRAQAAIYDPENFGINPSVELTCFNAYYSCYLSVYFPFSLSGYDTYDVGHTIPDPTFPPYGGYVIGFLNQHWVQAALGVPLNLTYLNELVDEVFVYSGDIARANYIENLGLILDRGIQLVMVHGDRDFVCNWLSGEATSLAINSTLKDGFARAGYTSISTNSSYNGGVVRQYGNFSFSRVFEAGHAVTCYQPETMYQIFNRALRHEDIATGEVSLLDGTSYSTTGPSSSFGIKNQMPVDPKKVCYSYIAQNTCTSQQLAVLALGTAVIENHVVVGYQSGNGVVYY